MGDYIIATDDTQRLMKKLATNLVEDTLVELSISTSSSTRTIWFSTKDGSGEGYTGGPVFLGFAYDGLDTPGSIARIEQEGNALILYTDL